MLRYFISYIRVSTQRLEMWPEKEFGTESREAEVSNDFDGHEQGNTTVQLQTSKCYFAVQLRCTKSKRICIKILGFANKS